MKKQPEVQPKRFHFSVERLEKLPIPSDKPAVYFDDDVKQLAVRIQPTGTRTFVTIKRSRGVTFRKTLGGFPELQIEAARKHASERALQSEEVIDSSLRRARARAVRRVRQRCLIVDLDVDC